MFGSIYAILVSWVVLPFYTSQKMLDIEYDVMNDGLALISSTWKPKEDKGGEKEGVEKGEGDDTNHLDLTTVDKLVDERLVAVHKEIENNTIDKNQLLLITWTLLPTPSVVNLLAKRLERLGVFLREYAQIKTTTIGALDGDQSPSSEFREFMSNIIVLFEECANTADNMMVDIRANFDAPSRAQLNQTRQALSIKVQALETSLEALTKKFVEWDSNRKDNLREMELKMVARSRLVVLAFKEFFVIAVLLAETEATVDRDAWYSALSSWFGRRPIV